VAERRAHAAHGQSIALALVGCLLTATYFAFPTGSVLSHVAYETIVVLGVTAIVVGLLRHRRGDVDWWLVVAGIAIWGAGDTYWNVFRLVSGHEAPFPSPADVFYLVCYVPLLAGFARLVRGRRPSVSDLIEGGIAGVGTTLVIWFAVVEPVARTSAAHVLERVTATAYPVADNLLILVLIQLVVARGLRQPALRMIVAAFALILGTDLVYARARVDASYSAGSWINAGYLLFYMLLGCAFLSPSLRDLASAPAGVRGAFSKRRLALLSVPLFIAPAFVAAGIGTNSRVSAAVLAAGMAAISLLVVARLALVFRDRDAVDRARLAAQKELAAMAYCDPLTRLANRSAFYHLLDAALVEATAARGPAVLFADLDGFKAVNDRYGHLQGDEVLRQAAERLVGAVRPADHVARHGGDEFVVALLGLAPDDAAANASLVAARISKQFERPFVVAGQALSVGVTVGIAAWPADGTTSEELVAAADEAMYRLKQEDRGSRLRRAG